MCIRDRDISVQFAFLGGNTFLLHLASRHAHVDLSLIHIFMVKRIGKTTYRVKLHCSETSKETMTDKIKRLILNDLSLIHI